MYRLRPWVGIVFTSSSLWKHRQHTAAEEEKEVGRSSSGHDRVIRKAEVAKHNSLATGVWVTHNDGVYDVTRFVANHPGGKEKLLLAAGASVDPFWRIYKQHLNSRLAEDILAPLRIGNLHPDDIASDLANMDSSDPYANDPPLSPLLRIHQNKPANAETSTALLTDNYLTPADIMFVRSHHPVPSIAPLPSTDDNINKSSLSSSSDSDGSSSKSLREGEGNSSSSFSPHHEVVISGFSTLKNKRLMKNKDDANTNTTTTSSSEKPAVTLTIEDLKTKFKKHEVVSSLQCGGNRRSEMSAVEPTMGISWGVGAFSTAKYGGAKLSDVLRSLLLNEEGEEGKKLLDALEEGEDDDFHVHFYGVDGMAASIPLYKALNRRGDVLLAYEMNDEPFPPLHGGPLRAIVPGHVAVRNVKWLKEVKISNEEAEGPWQRGIAYKGFGPSVKSVENINVEAIPSLQEQPVQSAITDPLPNSKLAPGVNTIKGFAYSGGGRRIIRVDVSADGGKTWTTATLNEGSQQPAGRAWAWTLWEADVDVPLQLQGSRTDLICKAVDESYNVQPDTVEGIWNLRGINNNAWHRVRVAVEDEDDNSQDEEEDNDRRD